MTHRETIQVDIGIDGLRQAIRDEYAEVVRNPAKGFHFHTGHPLAEMLGYKYEWLESVPSSAIDPFAGTGNPFSLGVLRDGEHVVDVGSGAGMDSLVASNMVGQGGHVIGVDMTPEMLEKARHAATEAGRNNVEFREGLAEDLPVPNGWADVVISNGVFNLVPDKQTALREMNRVLKPGGRLQIGDILVQKEVPAEAKQKVELWTG
ncbi:MAG: methyltransferase domain-containing protein [Dehalococcoidia bacterium]